MDNILFNVSEGIMVVCLVFKLHSYMNSNLASRRAFLLGQKWVTVPLRIEGSVKSSSAGFAFCSGSYVNSNLGSYFKG